MNTVCRAERVVSHQQFWVTGKNVPWLGEVFFTLDAIISLMHRKVCLRSPLWTKFGSLKFELSFPHEPCCQPRGINCASDTTFIQDRLSFTRLCLNTCSSSRKSTLKHGVWIPIATLCCCLKPLLMFLWLQHLLWFKPTSSFYSLLIIYLFYQLVLCFPKVV